jgi:hypothetical protein
VDALLFQVLSESVQECRPAEAMAEAEKADPAVAAAHDYEANRAALHAAEASKETHEPTAPVLDKEPYIEPPVSLPEHGHHEAVLVGDVEDEERGNGCGNCGLNSCPTIPFESIAKLSVWFLLMGFSLLLMGIVALAAPSLLKVSNAIKSADCFSSDLCTNATNVQWRVSR